MAAALCVNGAWTQGLTSDEGEDGLGSAGVLNELGSLLLCCASNLADHDDAQSLHPSTGSQAASSDHRAKHPMQGAVSQQMKIMLVHA